jgi:hypothetical protein
MSVSTIVAAVNALFLRNLDLRLRTGTALRVSPTAKGVPFVSSR